MDHAPEIETNETQPSPPSPCQDCGEYTCPLWCIAEIDRRLVAAGWDPITPWWWNVIRRSRGKKHVVVRGGRRGKKSTHVCIIAVSELLNPKHRDPPGEPAYFGIVSAVKDQAVERIRTCSKILKVLEVPHKALTETITLHQRNLGVRAFVATLKGVVSFTAIGLLCDEMARWQDKDTGANPAREVLGSLKPTMATMKEAQAWYVSSPWSTLDLHYEMMKRGETKAQITFDAPTWVMNPNLTEAETRELEEDEATWMREYGAIPMSSDETKFFAAEFIDRAASEISYAIGAVIQFVKDRQHATERIAAGGDFAFRRNSSALAVIEKRGQSLYVSRVEERVPGVLPLVPSATITELCGIAAEEGADSVACDLHYIESVREVTESLALPLLEFPTSNIDIVKAYVRVRVMLADGRINLAGAPKLLLDQLKDTSEKPTENAISIKQKTRGKKHGDLVSAFVCAVWAIDQLPMAAKPLVGERRFPRASDVPQSGSGKLTDMPTQADMD